MDSCKLISKCYITVTKQWVPQHDVTDAQIRDFDRTVIMSEICWVIVIWIVKYSILAFYWRLFGVNRRSIRIFIWALAAFVTCWGIAAVRSHPPILKLVEVLWWENSITVL